MAPEITRRWFDQLEAMLHADAELAGLLGHGTLIGDAREFFVGKALRSVLPPNLHIGTGRIIGHKGELSNQVDVVIYDPGFPVMETQPGQGIYLAEGTIAAIEVKSRIDGEKLRQSLDNCYSVASIKPSLVGRRIKMSLPDGVTTASKEFVPFAPATYIFGFKGQLSFEGVADIVIAWAADRGIEPLTCSALPRMVVAGEVLGVSSGEWCRPAAVDQQGQPLQFEGEDLLMSCWPMERPFSWLLIDLLLSATNRSSEDRRLAIEEYLPRDELQARLKGRKTAHITERKHRGLGNAM